MSADGRHFEKKLNRHNSATVRQIAMRFGMMAQFESLQPTVKILNFKNPRWRTAAILTSISCR